eukprot:Clim_evm32s253 gene=Clim_evmTU32s253
MADIVNGGNLGAVEAAYDGNVDQECEEEHEPRVSKEMFEEATDLRRLADDEAEDMEVETYTEGWWGNVEWLGYRILKSIDYVGESIADFFGITDSKYADVIEEHDEIMAEEAKEWAEAAAYATREMAKLEDAMPQPLPQAMKG